MRLQNFTKLDTELLREIIRFACPSGVSGFDIAFKNAGPNRGFSGWAYFNGSGFHNRSMRRQGKCFANRPYVVVKIARDGDIAYPHVTDFGKGYLRSVQFSKIEDIVHLVAHELRHLWQRRVKTGYRVWGARGQYSERDADAYAIQMVRQWRRR